MIKSKKIIAITGSTGSLGSAFVKKYKNYHYHKFRGDIKNYFSIKKWFTNINPEYFIHFAAIVPTEMVENNKASAYKTNVIGTRNILKVINEKKNNLKWFFFSSSSHVYKKNKKRISENFETSPSNFYGLTKIKAEHEVSKYSKNKGNKINYCIGRIFSFTSNKQKSYFLIPSIYKKLKKSKKKVVYSNQYSSIRDFIHIDDICFAINFLLSKNLPGIYNIGTGKKIKIIDILKILSKKLKKKVIMNNSKINYADSLVANINKMKKIGWNPKKGIDKILSDFLSFRRSD